MKVVIMEWKGIFYSLLFLVPTLESSSRSLNLWSLNLENGPTIIRNWAIISSGMFVVVAVLLSVFLIIQHLASYNQPEDQKFLIGLILMVPVYALESVERKELLSTYMLSVLMFQNEYNTGYKCVALQLLSTYMVFPAIPYRRGEGMQQYLTDCGKFSSIRNDDREKVFLKPVFRCCL